MTNPLLVSWPMYALDTAAVSAFWDDLRSAMREAGIAAVPSALSHPVDLVAHWCDPNLLLSQTCGYPFMTRLGDRVRYVATPCFKAAGCEGAFYRSAIVVRRDEQTTALPGFAGQRAAFNSRDSQSGYNVLRFLSAPHARDGRFFSTTVETGGHRQSLAAVKDGRADIAAIDVISLAHLQRVAPTEYEGLRILQFTPATAGLPLITSRNTQEDTVLRLRRAVAAACDPRRPGAMRLGLDGIAILEEKTYLPILDMENHAKALGYPEVI